MNNTKMAPDQVIDLEKENRMIDKMSTSRYKYIDEGKKHLHTLDGKPLIGTSSACKIIAKPLTWWASGMALGQLGWTNPKLVSKEEGIKIAAKARKNFFISNPEYYDWLQECYRAHDTRKKEAGTAGTDMHAELESYVKYCIENGGNPQLEIEKGDVHSAVLSFHKWSLENVEKFLWSEAHCYSERLWVGGITDAGAKMKDGNTAVIDFKSSKDAYYDQFIQAAGYSIQIEENGLLDANGNLIALEIPTIKTLYIVPFGAEDVTPRPHLDVEGRKQDFEAATRLYKSSQIFVK